MTMTSTEQESKLVESLENLRFYKRNHVGLEVGVVPGCFYDVVSDELVEGLTHLVVRHSPWKPKAGLQPRKQRHPRKGK